MKTDLEQNRDLSVQIAEAIRDAIMSGGLLVDERLPSEAELCEKFGVSRPPTVREALKRLAAQNLIRTQRGASGGGAFVNRISFEEAYGQQITTSTLLLSMNEVDFETACEARYAMERACVALSAARRTPPDQLATMRPRSTDSPNRACRTKASAPRTWPFTARWWMGGQAIRCCPTSWRARSRQRSR